MIYLIRHASAGSRSAWTDDDRKRPLDARGRAQAQWLVAELADNGVTRILTSPFDRCVQTVERLSTATGLAVEPTDALAEGATAHEARALLCDLEDEVPVLCSHGDVIPMLVGHTKPCKKGSIWAVEWDGVAIEAKHYSKPPKGLGQ